jgi:cytochrome c peroxidase
MRQASRTLLIAVLASICLAGQLWAAGELKPLGPMPVPADNPMSVEKVELGRMLFFDRRLSGDGTMSCATCHIPEMDFTDGLDISLNYPTTRNWRNSPTLVNVGYMKNLFHDGRAQSLEEQALFPIMSAFEMNQNLDYLEEELREVPEYVMMFKKVFDGEPDRRNTAYALAAFERTLVVRDAPLDRYLDGESDALSVDAKKGLDIFTGKGECIRCHHGAMLIDHGYHALGVPENPQLVNNPQVAATARFVGKVFGYKDYRELTEDPGRYLVTKDKADWKAFRTPTLREVSRTGPYMHNGVFKTLDEVINFYDKGCAEGNKEVKPLGLSPDEKKWLKTFLTEALTGEKITMKFPRVP